MAHLERTGHYLTVKDNQVGWFDSNCAKQNFHIGIVQTNKLSHSNIPGCPAASKHLPWPQAWVGSLQWVCPHNQKLHQVKNMKRTVPIFSPFFNTFLCSGRAQTWSRSGWWGWLPSTTTWTTSPSARPSGSSSRSWSIASQFSMRGFSSCPNFYNLSFSSMSGLDYCTTILKYFLVSPIIIVYSPQIIAKINSRQYQKGFWSESWKIEGGVITASLKYNHCVHIQMSLKSTTSQPTVNTDEICCCGRTPQIYPEVQTDFW